MILAILAFYFGYKKGRDSGRSGVLWAFICGLTFIGAQILVAIGFGAFIGIGIELWGWKETLYDDLTWVITIVSIAASVVPLLLIFRYLDRIPDQPIPTAPPPPPIFDRNE
jgi:membrane protein implicated in regulation of membrane protease activity